MELIIDIDEDVRIAISRMGLLRIPEEMQKKVDKSIQRGTPLEHVSNGDVYSASGYGVTNKTKFCPNCGAKMVEPQESEEV
jgi:hypothetical protein